MQYEVILKYAVDDATGEYGLVPVKTLNAPTPFNSFWSPEGVFHDVFEHYFEGVNKYYNGEGFLQLWGEMCASAHAFAYYELGLESFRYRKYRPQRDFTIDTFASLQEAMSEPDYYTDYGAQKETCLVPYQTLNKELWSVEAVVEEYKEKVLKKVKYNNPYVWIPGIARNYFYGFKQAQKIIGKDPMDSLEKMDEFLINWNKICKHDANNLGIEGSKYGLYGIKFRIKNTGKLSIKTTLVEEYTHEEFHFLDLIY